MRRCRQIRAASSIGQSTRALGVSSKSRGSTKVRKSTRGEGHMTEMDHLRQVPRCGAKTRNGTPCRAPAVKGKRRCRMHGGAAGSGAPKGNVNALKQGLYTKERLAQRKRTNAVLREAMAFLRGLKPPT